MENKYSPASYLNINLDPNVTPASDIPHDQKSSCLRCKGLFARPLGMRADKAWRLVRECQEKRKTEPQEKEKLNSPLVVNVNNGLHSITGMFARPLLPLPGEDPVENQWTDITKAPVTMQVEEILGSRYPDCPISLRYSSENFKEEKFSIFSEEEQPSISAALSNSSSTASLSNSAGFDDQEDTATSTTAHYTSQSSLSEASGSRNTHNNEYTGIFYFDGSGPREGEETEQSLPVQKSRSVTLTPTRFSLRSLNTASKEQWRHCRLTTTPPDFTSLKEFPSL